MKTLFTLILLLFCFIGFSQTEIKDTELIEKIETGKIDNGVVEFYSNNCSFCWEMRTICTNIASKYNGKMEFYKLDVDNSTIDFGTEGTPTYVFFKKGKITQIASGSLTFEEFELLINEKPIKEKQNEEIVLRYYPVDFVLNTETNKMTIDKKHIDPSKCLPEARHYSDSKNHFCCELPIHSEYLTKTLNEIDITTSNNYYECNKQGIWNTDVITTKYSDKSIDITTIIKKEDKIEFNSMNTLNGIILKKSKCSTGSINSLLYKKKVRTTPGTFKCTYFNEKLCSLVKKSAENPSEINKLEIKKYLESEEFISEEKKNYQKAYLEALYSYADRHRDFTYLENLGSSSLYTERYHVSMREYLESTLVDESYEYTFEALCEKINTPKKAKFNLDWYLK